MSESANPHLESAIGAAMGPDRHRLRTRWQALRAAAQRGHAEPEKWAELEAAIAQSAARRAARRTHLPSITYDGSLPIHARCQEIADATNTALGTVKSRLSRGRARLRDILLEQRELLPSRYRLRVGD